MDTMVQWAVTGPLVCARIAGVVWLLPTLGCHVVPWRLRVALCVLMGVLAVGMASDATAAAASNAPHVWFAALIAEGTLGAMLGLALRLSLVWLQMAGQLISQLAGLGIAQWSEGPVRDDQAPLARMFWIVALAVFVSIGGPLLAMAGVLETFRALPPGSGLPFDQPLGFLLLALQQSLQLAVRVALPLVVAVLAATLVVNLIQRVVPGFPTWNLSLPVNVLLVMALLGLSVSGIAALAATSADQAVERLINVSLEFIPG